MRRVFATGGSCIVLLLVIGTLWFVQYEYEHSTQGSYLRWQDFLICRLFELFLGFCVFVLGSSLASFFNVLAYRWPLGMKAEGSSFCPRCRTPIRMADNVPVFGWLWLGGRCRVCRLKISPRYPLFEALGGGMLLTLYLVTVLGHGRNLPWIPSHDLSYGLPVNLHLIDQTILMIAPLHGSLLMLLLLAAMLNWSQGALPAAGWGIALWLVAGCLFWKPELSIVAYDYPFSSDWAHPNQLPSASRALVSSVLGGWVALAIAACFPQVRSRRDWLGGAYLMGAVVGWQGAVIILFWEACEYLFEQLFGPTVCPTACRLAGDPIRSLWFWTFLFLLAWRTIEGSLQGMSPVAHFIFYLVVAILSIIMLRWGPAKAKENELDDCVV